MLINNLKSKQKQETYCFVLEDIPSFIAHSLDRQHNKEDIPVFVLSGRPGCAVHACEGLAFGTAVSTLPIQG